MTKQTKDVVIRQQQRELSDYEREVHQLRAKLDCARKALEAADCYCAKGRSTVGANSLCRNCEALAQINAGAGEETSDECACTTTALNGAPWTCPHGNKFNQAEAQQDSDNHFSGTCTTCFQRCGCGCASKATKDA